MRAVVLTVLINTLLIGTLVQLPPPSFARPAPVTDLVYAICTSANFTSNDSFAQNLNAVANSLTQNSSRSLYSFASSTTGSPSNYVHGMYQCRGDISLSDCSSCVINALAAFQTTNITQTLCGVLSSRGVQVQYQGCYLRYESFEFTVLNEIGSPVLTSCTGSANDSSPLYRQNLGTALNNSATAAPLHPLFGYNATSVGSGSNMTAYALTQCVGYLNSSQCATCLSQVSNYSNYNACNGVSGQVYFVDCYYLFGNTSLVFPYNNAPPINI